MGVESFGILPYFQFGTMNVIGLHENVLLSGFHPMYIQDVSHENHDTAAEFLHLGI